MLTATKASWVSRILGVVIALTPVAALKAERYNEARAAIGSMSLDQLTPFERSNTEQVLFWIPRAEGQYAEARQHILNAIDSGGLNEQEIANAQERLREIEATIATAPPT